MVAEITMKFGIIQILPCNQRVSSSKAVETQVGRPLT